MISLIYPGGTEEAELVFWGKRMKFRDLEQPDREKRNPTVSVGVEIVFVPISKELE
jgi:hypothetical protein